jgi:hypothetical protein
VTRCSDRLAARERAERPAVGCGWCSGNALGDWMMCCRKRPLCLLKLKSDTDALCRRVLLNLNNLDFGPCPPRGAPIRTSNTTRKNQKPRGGGGGGSNSNRHRTPRTRTQEPRAARHRTSNRRHRAGGSKSLWRTFLPCFSPSAIKSRSGMATVAAAAAAGRAGQSQRVVATYNGEGRWKALSDI